MTWIYQKEFDSCQECPEFETCYYVQIERDHWQETVAEGCINPYIKKKGKGERKHEKKRK